MVKTGRPPKPIEQHKREGTLSSHQEAKTPLLIGGREKPKCPSYLTKASKKAFRLLVEDLWESGILDKADAPLLITAAMLWGDAIEASEDVKKRGLVVEVVRGARDGGEGYIVREKNPSVQIKNDALAQFRQCCELLGIGPSARARLAHLGVKGKEPAKNIPGLDKVRQLRAVKDA
jgi:P27 family predicted phage terminase small subunit